jgi:hypothetical protein
MPNEKEISAWTNLLKIIGESPPLFKIACLVILFVFVYFMARLIIAAIEGSEIKRNLTSINSYMLEVKELMGRISVYLEKTER